MEITAPIDGLNAVELVARIRKEYRGLLDARDIFISAGRLAIERAIVLGECFASAVARYPGNYEEWLEATFEGEISVMTAWRWRRMWQRRDELLSDEPKLHSLKDAYVHLGMLPPPDPDIKPAEHGERRPYQLRLVIDTSKPLTAWPRADLTDFIAQTARVAELRAQAMELVAAS